MKKNIPALFKLFVLINLLALALLSMPEQSSTRENPIIGKHQVKGDFAMVADNSKSGLEGGQ